MSLVNKKKLLVITTVPDTLQCILRGQPRFLSDYYDICLIASGKSELSQVANDEGVRCFHVPMRRGISPFYDLLSIVCMIRVFWQFKPDIVHSYTPKAGLIAAVAGFMCNVPVRIHTFTGLIFPTSKGLKHLLLRHVDGLVCALCTHIVPEGRGVMHDLQVFHVCKRPMHVIGSGNIAGVDLAAFDPGNSSVSLAAENIRQHLGIHSDARVFSYIGRINKDKGLNELMSAFQHLSVCANVFLLVAGGEDAENPISSESLDVLKSHPCIHWFGFVNDVRPVIAASDFLVLPSYREGFPNVVLQAGALAKPCLVTNVSGSNEIIQAGFNGLIVPPSDEMALYEAMLKMAAWTDQMISTMGQSARALIIEKFDRTRYWRDLLSFYRRAENA